MREVYRHLVDGGIIADFNGEHVTLPLTDLGVPEGVRQVVAQRLVRLSPDTNGVPRWVAAFPGGVDFAVLWALTEMDEDALLGCLDEAPDPALRCELLLSLGDALNRAGIAPRARDAFERAAAAARIVAGEVGARTAAPLLARAALGLGWWVEGREDVLQISLLREALDALDPRAATLRSMVMGRLGQADPLHRSP